MKEHDFELIDLPIEFKEINPDDFDSRYYHVSEKEIIQANQEGYISDKIIEVLKPSFDEKNTVVINAGVGQGKTTAVIQLVKEYSKNDDYVVILAVPYNSLIHQYQESILSDNHFSESSVFSINNIDGINFPLKVSSMELMGYGFTSDTIFSNILKVSNVKVHIMTINGLLGNPGEDNLFQSKKRETYYNKLITYCRKNNKKIVVFFDEIHDGIHNFKEEYIYKLWRYQGLIYKNYVVSATFNEASKEVIKYLSEFTDRKIQIIESERTIVPGKQSKLHLLFHEAGDLSSNFRLNSLLKKIMVNYKKFDVVVYSKNQISNLMNMMEGQDYYVNSGIQGVINLCYNDLTDKKANKRYQEDKINIGTNFTTGVNITSDSHTLIVILPKRVDFSYIDNKGVFSSGVSAVIQTLARQRKPGDIYVVMPPPLEIEEASLPYNSEVKNRIKSFFDKYREPESKKKINYTYINSQGNELNAVYGKLKSRVVDAKEFISNTNRKGMNRLKYPPKEIFSLEKGERYLTNSFFGGDLASYVFWASITNQFQNCRLVSIVDVETILYEEKTIYSQLFDCYLELIKSYPLGLSEGTYLELFSEYRLYEDLVSSTVDVRKVLIDNKKATKKRLEELKLYLLNLVITKPAEIITYSKVEAKNIKEKLYRYYLRSCLKYSQAVDLDEDCKVKIEIGEFQFDNNTCQSIKLFKSWLDFIELLKLDILEREKKDGVVKYLPLEPSDKFISLFRKNSMEKSLKLLSTNQKMLSTDLFPFKDGLRKCKNETALIKYFYGLLVKLFFETETKQVQIDGTRTRMFLIISEYDFERLPPVNLLYDFIPLWNLDSLEEH